MRSSALGLFGFCLEVSRVRAHDMIPKLKIPAVTPDVRRVMEVVIAGAVEADRVAVVRRQRKGEDVAAVGIHALVQLHADVEHCRAWGLAG